jgi:2-methylcitrate dehydratase PrpD
VQTDPTVMTQKCDLTVTLKDGRVLSRHVENAIGSLEKPLSDAALEAKFTGLAAGVLPPEQAKRLIGLCWGIETAPDAGLVGAAAAASAA